MEQTYNRWWAVSIAASAFMAGACLMQLSIPGNETDPVYWAILLFMGGNTILRLFRGV